MEKFNKKSHCVHLEIKMGKQDLQGYQKQTHGFFTRFTEKFFNVGHIFNAPT